ncbi:MAG: 1,4-dihydroxy-2-naphthoate polyprenyltransferase [Verrucomicrobia bacterium]|nr:1,4-dihydroxy-2-naphthoate polyprenyltransferase [Cytophagales bacterium]
MKNWISAMRLRTLPLTLSSIGMGSFLAVRYQAFRWDIFILCVLTTVFLQILSNFANDYGDSINGADHNERQGPKRAVQSGVISSKQMFNAIILLSALSLTSGILLLWRALQQSGWETIMVFFGLGLLSIVAAITYTAGKKPYGYAGLGDLAVIIFFGWVGVIGTFYLFVHRFDILLLLPATSCGLFAVAVLNVNNIRDIESDKKAGKRSVPVRIGRKNAVVYHWTLLGGGLVCTILYVIYTFQDAWQFLFLLTLPLFIMNAIGIYQKEKASEIDPYLRQMALTSLGFMLTFGIGQILSTAL